MLDRTGRVATWNPGAERFKGYTADEIIGQNFSIFFTPEDREAGLPQRALQHRRWPRAVSKRRAGAFARTAAASGRMPILDPVLDPQGKHVGFAKITRDITAKREQEKALCTTARSGSECSSRACATTPSTCSIPRGASPTGIRARRRIKGYTADEIVGQHFSRFYTDEDKARGEPQFALETALREGKYEREAWRVRKDGSPFWASVVLDPIFDEIGKHVGFAKITRDITERKKAQEQLEETQAALVPVAEASGARRADGRHRSRLQQSDDGDRGLRGLSAAEARPARREAPPVSRGDRRDRRPRDHPHQSSARVRPAPADQARSARSQRPPRRDRRHALTDVGQRIHIELDLQLRRRPGRGRCRPAGNRDPERRGERPRRHAGRRHAYAFHPRPSRKWRGLRRAGHPRHRHGHAEGSDRSRVRALLYDKGGGQGHRPRPLANPRLRGSGRRTGRDFLRGRPRNDHHLGASANRKGHCFGGPEPGPCRTCRRAFASSWSRTIRKCANSPKDCLSTSAARSCLGGIRRGSAGTARGQGHRPRPFGRRHARHERGRARPPDARNASGRARAVSRPATATRSSKRGSEFDVLAKPFGAADLSKAMAAVLNGSGRSASAARRG